MRPNKYRAKPTNGFPSKLESAVYDFLHLRQRAGEITDIKRQQTVVLVDGSSDVRITWKVDFSFTDNANGQLTYAEAKGFETETYRLKLKLWRYLKPHPLEIYKGSGLKLKLVERIEV